MRLFMPRVAAVTQLIPLSAIVSWPKPNYVDPETRTWLVPVNSALALTTTVLLGARLWARWTGRAGKFGADDALIIAAWIFADAFTAASIYAVAHLGFDRHVWDTNPRQGSQRLLLIYLTECIFIISTCLTKISILLFYRRVVTRTYSQALLRTIYAAIGFIVAYGLFFILFGLLRCKPIGAQWLAADPRFKEPFQCIGRHGLDVSAGTVSVITDIYALALPALLIKTLHVTLKQRILLYAIFGCGILVVGTGIVRTIFLVKTSSDPKLDFTWLGYEVFMWSQLEMELAIICACAPALKVFFDPAKLIGSRNSKSSKLRNIEADSDYFDRRYADNKKLVTVSQWDDD